MTKFWLLVFVLLLSLVVQVQAALPSVTNFKAAATSPSKITLTWSYTNGSNNGFTIDRSQSSSSGYTTIASVNKNTRSYNDANLYANTSYTYRIRAYKGGGGGSGNVSQYTVVSGKTQVMQPPVVVAGMEQNITSLQTTVQGTVFVDGLSPADVLTYQWSIVSGPVGVVFTTANALTTLVTFPTGGMYDLRLTATVTTATGVAGASSSAPLTVIASATTSGR